MDGVARNLGLTVGAVLGGARGQFQVAVAERWCFISCLDGLGWRWKLGVWCGFEEGVLGYRDYVVMDVRRR